MAPEPAEDRASRRSDRQRAGMLFALAVAVRVFAAVRTPVIFADGPSFVELAERLAAGDWEGALRHPYHPLYPLLMLVARPLAGDLETAGIFVSVLGGGLAVIALHAFLRDAFDARVAGIGALLLALAPYAVRFSSDVQSDGVYLGLFLLGVAALWRALARPAVGIAALAGVVAGLAYLTRPEGVGIVLVGCGLGLLPRATPQLRGRQRWRWLVALVGGFGAVALPYLWALAQVNGSWMLSGKKSIGGLLGVVDAPLTVGTSPGALLGGLLLLGLFALGLRRPRWPRELPAQLRTGLVVIGLLGLAIASRRIPAVETYSGVVVSAIGPGIAVWAAVGLLVRRTGRRADRSLFIAAFLALYGLVLAALLLNYGYLSRRHALPPLCLLLGHAAVGTTVLAEALRRGSRGLLGGRGLSGAASLAVAVAIVGSTEVPKTFRRHRDDALADRRAAEWLRAQQMPAGSVAATKHRTAYYADRAWVPLRDRAQMRDAGSLPLGSARYVIVDREIPPARDPDGPLLLELHRVETGGEMAVVYRVERAPDR